MMYYKYMFEVKVFDGRGNLKEVVSSEEVSRRCEEAFFKGPGTLERLTFKTYVCVECKISFESNSSRGANYCKDCRPKAYRRSRKKNNVSSS